MKDNGNILKEFYYTDGVHDYARYLAFSLFAVTEIDIEGKSFCSGITEEGEHLYLDIIKNGDNIIPIKKEDYNSDSNVQNSLSAMGINPKKFWIALLYAYNYALNQNSECINIEPSAQEKVKSIIEALKEPEASITVLHSDKKQFEVKDTLAINYIREMLERGNEEKESDGLYVYGRGLLSSPKEDNSDIWLMKDFYDALSLVIDKFRTDQDLPTRVKGQIGSRNKDLLISRLIYMVKITENKAFLGDVDALKGKKRYWKENNRPRKHPTYGFDDGEEKDFSGSSGPTLLV